MTPVNTQQEILFFTGTRFAQAELKSTDSGESSSVSKTDQLENAFWNGMLFEMLPELQEKNVSQDKMYLWRINNYGSFMSISFGQTPDPIEHYFSIDPYLFIQNTFNN